MIIALCKLCTIGCTNEYLVSCFIYQKNQDTLHSSRSSFMTFSKGRPTEVIPKVLLQSKTVVIDAFVVFFLFDKRMEWNIKISTSAWYFIT